MADTSLVALAGLGNPGPDYARTRHNAGFWLADRLVDSARGSFRHESKFFGELARVRVAGTDVLVLKPSTYMNRSGQAVAALLGFYKIPPENLLVAHDELDLPVGTARFKFAGGHGGHNGLRDIHKPIGDQYRRVRIGVGHPGDKNLVMHYLTDSRPSRAEEDAILQSIDRAVVAIHTWLSDGWDRATQALHSTPAP
ncbi:MAG TPA: aminoacyl-tRNA hydrolase [Nevskiaceae bacterium]|nr:aminoacyl-tRNA hydrolase [Nevskiaceae bacterium]